MKKQQGFTLTEIAIVIVVIGLLLGSILKGQQIITTAKIKNIEGSFNNLSKAIYTYRERYGKLPGDDNEVERFPNITSNLEQGGNGNGLIDGPGGFASYKMQGQKLEYGKVWLHLRVADLIKGPSDPTKTALSSPYQGPTNAFGGKTGIGSGLPCTATISTPIQGEFIGFTHIPSNVAAIIDQNNDDNIPYTGRIRAEDKPDKLLKGSCIETEEYNNPQQQLTSLLFFLN
jgi:prepilin-type N-terminal cleavage/methylation domain-containing protein